MLKICRKLVVRKAPEVIAAKSNTKNIRKKTTTKSKKLRVMTTAVRIVLPAIAL